MSKPGSTPVRRYTVMPPTKWLPMYGMYACSGMSSRKLVYLMSFTTPITSISEFAGRHSGAGVHSVHGEPFSGRHDGVPADRRGSWLAHDHGTAESSRAGPEPSD